MHGQPVVLWRKDGKLKATEQMPDSPGPRRPSAFTAGTGEYPLIDRYGMGWVWYGDPANASPELMPHVPILPEEGLPRRFQSNLQYDCAYELLVENLLDLTHADFLHSWLTGDSLSDDDEIFVESTSETVTMTRISRKRPIPRNQQMFARGHTHQNLRAVTIAHVRSGVSVLRGDFNPGLDARLLATNTPESPFQTRAPTVFNPQALPWLARNMFAQIGHVVARQDNFVLRPQNKAYLQPRLNSDLSSRFDKAGLRYRKVHQELQARQQVGDVSYRDDPGRDISAELHLGTRF
jgi:phenylpropionate dioxygenase-like ring-hydroxylating dioxygenase large terminal subunit